MKREEDFSHRRIPLENLDDEQLEQKFWDLADQVVKPLVDMARSHTSPSIERSVLLRMGFSSIEAGQIVRHCTNQALLGKGAGHVVLRFAQKRGIDYRRAGLILARGEGWDEARQLFGKERLS